MIEEIKGDAVQMLLDGKVNLLIQNCNCEVKMGSGIALQIKNKIPDAFKVDQEFDKKFTPGTRIKKLGKISIGFLFPHLPVEDWDYSDMQGGVINLYGQLYPDTTKRALNYEAFARGCEKILDIINPSDVLCCPKLIGCDRAGGSWKIVRAILYHYFHDLPNKFYIVEWDKNEK